MELKLTPGEEDDKVQPMQCPGCGAKIEVRHTHYPHFSCPNCRETICVAPEYLLKIRILSAIVSFGITYFLGMRGLLFVVVAIFGFLATASIATVIGLVVTPPMIEKCTQGPYISLKL